MSHLTGNPIGICSCCGGEVFEVYSNNRAQYDPPAQCRKCGAKEKRKLPMIETVNPDRKLQAINELIEDE